MTSGQRVSIAIPVHNEEEVLPELLRRLSAVLDQTAGGPHEVVFVDDGSRDRSLALLREAARHDPRVRAVALSRNFGHQAAVTAALDHCRGDVVVVMDADLQDPPEAIPPLLAAIADGHDVAYATRVRRKESLPLRLSYALAYRVIASLSRVDLPLDAGDFCAMSRRVVDHIRRAPEHNRYIRGLRSWVGFRQVAVPVERSSRFAGTSKYSVGALFRLAFDGIFAFSAVPLRVAAVAGLVAILLSALFATYAVYARLAVGQVPPGFTASIVLMTFLAGVQLTFLGIIGEYIGRIYEDVKARPLYVVDAVIGHVDSEEKSLAAHGR